MKTEIVKELGQPDILLPRLVAEGLAANDRIKLRLSALQAAVQHARQPRGEVPDLTAESRAAGLAPAALVTLIGGAHLAGDDKVVAPGLAPLLKGVESDIVAMISAVAAGEPPDGQRFEKRLASIRSAGHLDATPEIEIARIGRLTGVESGGPDSLHRLVMDLHKALNRLAARNAEAVIDGAHVFGVRDADHAPIASFMRGLNETRPLKFNHPGLDATAIRAGDRLVIQNDIGTTDAHVIVIIVTASAVTITYTDVHLARAKFFVSLFEGHALKWSGLDKHSAAGLEDDGTFYLVTGTYDYAGPDDRDDLLAAIGASLVFLIDWNKARKLLRSWVAKTDAVRILEWAARQRIGHRGFLELGGNELLGAAVRSAAPTRLGFGERLDQVLGREAAISFLKACLQISTEALLEGQSSRLARDRIGADLVRHLDRVDSGLLAMVLRQIGLARDVAALVQQAVAMSEPDPLAVKQLAERAGRIEQKADRIAIEARAEITRLDARPVIGELVDRIEQAIDELEQAAFIASLSQGPMRPEIRSALQALAAVGVTATEHAAAGLAAAAEVQEGRRADSEDALAAVARLMDAEHQADASEREITARVFAGGLDVTASLAALELSRAIERATDCLASFGHLLRRYTMSDLSA
ncbi:conserved hypothetical protein [Bradyrhizobium sp. ORS 375]|uniref:DUF47 family protein n=1 Tax=Bradyrhizobium sp. (strain ORS 375) TaxID=566679 RepID=UPI00024064B5|nr:DUF47 family protein [Bradyrhizobium sp. ORS 375]CCD95912.1 conserved hypothetical protein [Bradyrhizobium sp. ORS 375]